MAILLCKHHLKWGADAMFLFNEMGEKLMLLQSIVIQFKEVYSLVRSVLYIYNKV